MIPAYADLEARFKRLNVVRQAGGVLQWDLETLMPPGGAAARTEQLATLSVIGHELITDPKVGDAMATAESADGLDAWQAANLRGMKREWRHAVCLPADLVEAHSKAVSECELFWRRARPANDFKGLLPLLQRVLDLTRKIATIKAKAFGVPAYEALLDQYEPGATQAEITPLFNRLAAFLPGFIDAVLEKQARGPKILPLPGPFPAAKQMAPANRVRPHSALQDRTPAEVAAGWASASRLLVETVT